MAITGTLYKLSWGGPLFDRETWSCGLYFLSATGGVKDPEAFAAAISQWMLRASGKVHTQAKLEFVKFNEINPATGKYADESASQTHFYLTPPGGAGGNGPGQLTVAVSTVTEATRGLASKGRYFPPTGGVESAIGADGTAQGIGVGIATSNAQLITDLNGAHDGECVVFSKQGQTTREITGVRVGEVVDTQRRRRNQLVEVYHFVAVS